MSDARWTDVEEQIERAMQHFRGAIRVHAASTFDDSNPGRDAAMSLMHYMQSAHTSIENALERILDILGEEKPDGNDWHTVLINRLARPMTGEHERPALLTREIADDLHETKNFRHRATRSYDDFNVSRANPSLEAAGRLLIRLPGIVDQIRTQVDPDTPSVVSPKNG